MKLKLAFLNILRIVFTVVSILSVVAFFKHFEGDFWGIYFSLQELYLVLLMGMISEISYKYVKLQLRVIELEKK